MSFFDRTLAVPAPAVRRTADRPTYKVNSEEERRNRASTRRPIGRKPGPMPKVWRVACRRTPLRNPDRGMLLFDKSFAYRRTAERVLATLVQRYVGDANSAVEFAFENTKGGSK